jgi:hypothetical protein
MDFHLKSTLSHIRIIMAHLSEIHCLITFPLKREATGLDGRGSIPGKARDFSLLHSIQTASADHPTS